MRPDVSVSNIKISIGDKSLITRAYRRGGIYECKNVAEILPCLRNSGVHIYRDRMRPCLGEKRAVFPSSAGFRARDLIALGQKAANRPQINGGRERGGKDAREKER